MFFTGYELLWLFLVYSFLGWIFETVAAAIKQKRFANRGLVNLPFCMLYGVEAGFITIFGAELQGVWLYIGSVIIITVFKWFAGKLITRIYHERWWDYSKKRWNIDGYVSLADSVIGGIVAVIIMKWGNALFARLFGIMPRILGRSLIWTLLIVLAVDIIATLIVIHGAENRAGHWAKLEQKFTSFTNSFSQKIYLSIEKRVHRAYPDARKLDNTEESDIVFASGCSFYKLLWLFVIGSFLGDITETIFCRMTMGVWMSRSSVVWGPFSVVWGGAIVIATVLLHKYKDGADRVIFFAGTVLGGAYEYACSVFAEIVFGKVFWDYSHIRFNLGGRINLLYCFFWGFAAVVWIKGIYPVISAWIEKVPVKTGRILSRVMLVFMCCNIVVSSLALIRSEQREEGIRAEYTWQKVMDERFDDERLHQIYPKAKNK